MFILEINDVGATMFAKGQKVESNIDMWHKQVSHINFQKLQELQLKQVVFRLPKFSGRMGQICEACLFREQHRLPFPNEKNQSRNRLDLIHTNVWGPVSSMSMSGIRYFLSFIDTLGST